MRGQGSRSGDAEAAGATDSPMPVGGAARRFDDCDCDAQPAKLMARMNRVNTDAE